MKGGEIVKRLLLLLILLIMVLLPSIALASDNYPISPQPKFVEDPRECDDEDDNEDDNEQGSDD